MRTHDVATAKESYPNSDMELAGLAGMWYLDETQDGIITAHALVMEATVSWVLQNCHSMPHNDRRLAQK